MQINDLIIALQRLTVETGSLACLGCGHEHDCSTKGCALIREAVDLLIDLNLIQERPPVPTLPAPINPRVDWVFIQMLDRLHMYENLGKQVTPNEEG